MKALQTMLAEIASHYIPVFQNSEMLCYQLRWLPKILTRLRHSLCGHEVPRMSRSEVCVCPPSILYFHPIASLANIAFTVSSSPDIAFTVSPYWITSLSPYHLNGWHRFHRIAFYWLISLSLYRLIVWHHFHCLTLLSDTTFDHLIVWLRFHHNYHLFVWRHFHRITCHHFYCITLLSDFTFTVSPYCLTSLSPYHFIVWHHIRHIILLSDIIFTVSP